MRYGFIGLGVMGQHMAANMLRAGLSVMVNDINRSAAEPHLALGASWAESPGAMARACDAVFTCLPNFAAIETVAMEALATAKPGFALFEMSTNSATLLRKLHTAYAAKGAALLDAPISGGVSGAESGKLAIWVGGDRATYDRFKPALDAMGEHVTHVGPSGVGLVTKIVHNASSQAMQAALAEVFSLGVKAGADPVALWQAIRQGVVGRRRGFDGLSDEFLTGQYDPPSAHLRIVYKDTLVATELGRELGVPLRMTNLAFADLQEAMARGWGERDSRSVMLLAQERAGVKIAEDRARIKAVLDADPPAPTDVRHGKG